MQYRIGKVQRCMFGGVQRRRRRGRRRAGGACAALAQGQWHAPLPRTPEFHI